MGKVKTRFLGLEEVEKQQKQEQKKKKQVKQLVKKKIHLPGMKGGERTVTVEVTDAALEKLEKTKKFLTEEKPQEVEKEQKKQVKKQVKARIRGKNYLKANSAISKNEKYDVKKALALLKKAKLAKFDESVELHLNAVQEGLKGEAQLPHSTGKTVRVKVVDDKLLDQIEQGKIDFDILVTHPSFMPELAKHAKILGPKGLMPNPKTGTISDKPEETAKKFQSGSLRWKTEAKAPIIHLMVGKISFDQQKLAENIEVVLESVGKANIKSVFLKTSMSPAIRLNY